MHTTKKLISTRTLVLSAIMTALVIILQGTVALFPTFFGPFSTAVALVPIVIGAALCGPWIGAWLGLVFALVVLISGGATFFMQYDPFATILVVIAKGTLCGLASGLVYKALKKINDILAAVIAALVCPVVNTGIFLLGGMAFLTDNLMQLAGQSGFKAGIIFFWGLAMANFLFEIGMSVVLSPIIVKILSIRKKMN